MLRGSSSPAIASVDAAGAYAAVGSKAVGIAMPVPVPVDSVPELAPVAAAIAMPAFASMSGFDAAAAAAGCIRTRPSQGPLVVENAVAAAATRLGAFEPTLRTQPLLLTLPNSIFETNI